MLVVLLMPHFRRVFRKDLFWALSAWGSSRPVSQLGLVCERDADFVLSRALAAVEPS